MDERGRHVARFATQLRNAGRLGSYAEAIVEMYRSGDWRDYTTASGREQWRECEFDYFLISCDASHTDLQRILSWDTAKAADVAGAMDSDDPRKRRPIEEAAAAWPSPTGASLLDLAGRNGWTNSRGVLRTAPVPARARVKVRHGVSQEELARKHREELIDPGKRREISKRLDEALQGLSKLELRYVRDLVNERLANEHGSEPTRR